jgi:2-polyprenyl-3-methyl-5-hydroxy-6-metoxy-1,4-benzoquinol methylase
MVKDHLLSAETFPVVKCQDCGFVFTQEVPAPEEIGKYYQSQDYVSHSDTRKGLMNKVYHLSRNFMLGKKYRMVKATSPGKNLLDIGCGTGYFPAFMKGKGYNVTGVEADQKTREYAVKEFGLQVLSPDEFLSNESSGSYDVITLWHVLEHLHNFDEYIEKMLANLRPGGVILFALPNCSAFDARYYKEYWAGYDVPRHLWHFTPGTLNLLLEKHGLKLMKMKRLPLDPFYNAMLSEKYRKNKMFMIAGLIIGKIAYLESIFYLKKSSSLVYYCKHHS